ncbi:MAG: B12-binding domain-containing radical SAM protein [Saprospiraceae bacterium]|nr:B12-binding domain-containing radical SAM protein [Saprospiraceae bacterium]
MNVLFTHGYFLCEDPREQQIMKPYPPLGLLYLSAWLDKHGVENEVFDTTFSEKKHLWKYLIENRPHIVALYANLMTKRNVLEIAAFIHAEECLRDTLVVMGGPDVTHNAADYLAHGADVIVIGEGEQTMLDICLSAEHGGRENLQRFAHIPGLAFLQADGLLFKTPPREKLRDIDALPFPNRHKIDLQQYLSAWKKAHSHSAVSISTQRGCPYTCRWCSTAVYGQSYRRRSPEKVVDEIVFLKEHYHFDLIWFVDDVFTVSHKWLGEFCDELRHRNVRIQFECITRADRLNAAVIDLLREAGCFRVWIGAESGSQRIIDAMDRRVDVQQVRQMIRAASEAGIQTGTFIMLGYPGETERDIRDTVAHLQASNPDLFTITVAYPIKGTGLYEEVQSATTTQLPWAESTDRDLDFKRTYPRPYYDYAVRWTVNAVHRHKLKLAGEAYSIKALKMGVKTAVARAGMWWWRGWWR